MLNLSRAKLNISRYLLNIPKAGVINVEFVSEYTNKLNILHPISSACSVK